MIVDILAAFRLTRLVTKDEFPPVALARERVLDSHAPDWFKDMIQCPWCIGFWISCAVVVLRIAMPKKWPVIAAALATSAGVGLISERDDAEA